MNWKNIALIGLMLSLAFTGVGVGAVSAESGPSPPDGVNCTYNETQINEYQPRIITFHLEHSPTAVYSAKFTDKNNSTDVYVYWARYRTQNGILGDADSHYGDHEPVYVYVDNSTSDDSTTGEIERVVWSGYHYMKSSSLSVPTDGQNPKFKANKPYHHYSPTTDLGVDHELKNFCSAYPDWYSQGWEASEKATLNPWTMRERASWWARDIGGYSVEESYYHLLRWVSGLL